MKDYSANDILSILQRTLNELNSRHKFLLENKLGETCLNHQLACILKSEFKNFDVDCEYNLESSFPGASKILHFTDAELEKFVAGEDREEAIKKIIRPDIIIHRRGTTENLIMIEAKRKSNRKENLKNFDREKLKKATSKDSNLGYLFGVFIEYCDGISPIESSRIHAVEIYSNGKMTISSKQIAANTTS